MGPRVADAMELAEMGKVRFHVSEEAREWVVEMEEETARSKWELTTAVVRLLRSSM